MNSLCFKKVTAFSAHLNDKMAPTQADAYKRTAMQQYVLWCIGSAHAQYGARGGIVVKALCYKLAGRRFDFRWCHWNFSVTQSFWSNYGPGVNSASNRNEYQVYFLGEKAAGAWGWQPYHHPVLLSWNLGTLTSCNPLGHSRPVMGLLYLYLLHVQYVLWCIWQCTHTVCSEHKPQCAAFVHTVSLTSHHFHKMVERCFIIVEDQNILTCIHKLKIKFWITGSVLQVSTPYTNTLYTSLFHISLTPTTMNINNVVIY
jgi:hypothetical protein